MEKKSRPELALPFLLFAALHLEAAVLEKMFYCPAEKFNWTYARTYCQKNHVDLVTWNNVDQLWLSEWLVENEIKQVWIGLHRDSGNDSVWKWINVYTGEGITGDDLSQSSFWASGEQSSHCAYVSSDLTWYSDLCSSLHSTYCSQGTYIKYFKGSVTWDQSSQYCQQYNSTLATINNTNEKYLYLEGWIGLYRVAGNNWSWIGDQTSNYSKWASGQPLVQDCGLFNANTDMCQSSECSQNYRFVCIDDNMVLVHENKTWEEALLYCNNMTTPCDDSNSCIYQLLNLQYSSDYSYVKDRLYTATTNEVWMGLRFLGGQWFWMNGQVLDDNECPPEQKHCGTLSKNDSANWSARDCAETRNFICISYSIT